MIEVIEHYIAILLVAAGTYLSRFLPLHFNENFRGDVDEFLTHSSTALLSALFITSLISFPLRLEKMGIAVVALMFVFASYKKWSNLGISVLLGVVVHILLSLNLL